MKERNPDAQFLKDNPVYATEDEIRKDLNRANKGRQWVERAKYYRQSFEYLESSGELQGGRGSLME